ncbi:MAG TPA: EthD family reductase [Candidatus Kryptonia bacterium]
MVKLVAMFKKPDEPGEFDDHYENVHLPLVLKMPGMKRIEISKVTGAPMSVPHFYRMAEMYFENPAALNRAITSPEGIAAAKDLMSFAGGVMEMFFAEVRD